MSMLPDHGGSSRSEESHGTSPQKVDETKDEFDCGLNADSDYVTRKGIFFKDVLLHLRSVAMNPCSKDESFKKFRESQCQILNAREALFLEKTLSSSNAKSPQKRLKPEKLLPEKVTSSKLPSKKPRVQSFTEKKSCSLATSSSCLISPSESVETSDHVRLSLNSLTPCHSDAVDGANPSNKKVMTMFESDGSVSGSNLLSTMKPILRTSERAIKLLKSGNNVPKRRAPDHPRNGDPFVNYCDGSVNSLILASKKSSRYQKPPRSLNFDKHHERMPIPVSPRFQADIPDWSGLPNRDISLNNEVNADESEKWLGTRIWPTGSRHSEVCRKSIGIGRPASCSCRSPGSSNCIKHHIAEKRQTLQLDLGSAFFSWKFDEMGEEVSKSWTHSEQKSFEALVNSNPVSKKMSFWKPALESFPTKTKESIVSYYFNVFVPSRMGRQTRLEAPKEIDSDDDEFNESIGGSKDSKKAKYLTGLR